MKGIMDIGGEVVKNKREAIRKATEQCEGNDPCMNNGFRAYVMRYDDPDTVWFSVGYGDYDKNITNYVKLDPRKNTEWYDRMDRVRERHEHRD